MPYDLRTKDGIVIRNIPDDIDPRSDELRQRVLSIRAERDGTGVDVPVIDPDTGNVINRAQQKQQSEAPGVLDHLAGAGETALSMATGATTGAAGMIGGALSQAGRELASGEFGTNAAADRIEQNAMQMAESLTYAPQTESGQNQLNAVGAVAQQLAPLTPMGSQLSAAGHAAKLGINKAYVSDALRPKRTKIAEQLIENPNDPKLVGYLAQPDGTAIKIKHAKQAVNQGFDPGVIGVVKNLENRDKVKMRAMVQIVKKGMKDAEYKSTHRPTDIPGLTVVDQVNHVLGVKREAGQNINNVAKKIGTNRIDATPVVNDFVKKMEDMGVGVSRDEDGALKLDFKYSDIERVPELENAIKNVAFFLSRFDENTPAIRVHRLKRNIDGSLNWDAPKTGLASKVESSLKDVRTKSNTLLRDLFPEYAAANEKYAMTTSAINALQDGVGRKLNLSDKRALGRVMRRTLGNAQSRESILDALVELETVYKKTGGKADDNLRAQILFADELDYRFKLSGRTAFAAQVKKGMAEAIASEGGMPTTLPGIASKVIGGATKAIQGNRVTDEKALKAIDALLAR